jgi:protein tyrosine/serine phosphatase
MKVKSLALSLVVGIFFAVSASFSLAQTSPSKVFNNVKVGISNFGKMDDRFYRGSRPGKKDFAMLKSIGINTIIDLTDNTPEEKGLAEEAGLKYVNIPIKDKSYPTDEAVASFIKTVNDPETGVFYVHCAGGRHRTGDMGAVYRFSQGWDYDKVYSEMKNYDFYSSGHQSSLDFVVDYSKKAAAAQHVAQATAGTATMAAENK